MKEGIQLSNSYIYINDDEVNYKHILIRFINSKKCKKTYTLSGAEKRGLVKIENGFYKFGGRTYSKSIALLNSCVSICLTTKIFG
jgi:hypothetical protein